MSFSRSNSRGALLAALAVGVLLIFGATPVFAATKHSGGATGSSSGCSITPGQVALDQVWTVSAKGLPARSSTSMIITFPDGAQDITAITVGSGGSYQTTGNSNMSAGWGFITPEQTGTYDYKFVGRMKWPAGTYSSLYAECSVVVG